MIWGLTLLAACALATMAVAWFIAERTGKSGWADAVWSICVGSLGVTAALAPVGSIAEPTFRQWVVAALAAGWSIRLALHVAVRTHNGGEDPRYAELRRQWGTAAPRRLFWFLQIQAVVAVVLALCIGLAAHNPEPQMRMLDWFGLVVMCTALLGESIADRQLQRFRAQPENRGAVCDIGLWRLSRHPNYFFEWLVWVSYPLIAIDLTGGYFWGWLSLAAPALMYWLLVHVSGIPPLEEHMLRTRDAAFRAYKAQVNAFWPGPPRPYHSHEISR